MIRSSSASRLASTDGGSAAEYRRLAEDCVSQASDPRASGDERAYLLTKRRSLIALAAAEDWLNGKVSPRTDH